MRRFFEPIVDHPKKVLFLFALLTVFFLIQIPNVPVETDLKKWLPEGNPEVEYYDEVRELFGLKSKAVIAIANNGPDGIFNPVTLELVAKLTDEVKTMDGVIEEDVVSLATQDNIIGTADGLKVTPFMEGIPTTPEDVSALREAVQGNDMYYGTLVSKDDKGTLILAKFVDGIDKVSLYHQVRDLVEKHRSQYPTEKIFYAGRPVLEGVLREEVLDDMRVMMPIVILVVLVLLAVTLRTLRGILLPFITVVICAIWTLGAMALSQSPLYSMSTMVPVILTAVGCAYGIHIISRYYEAIDEDESRPRREIVLETMKEMWAPVVMTALTTVVGFLSMVVSRSLPPRSVGVFTAIGVAAATLTSLTVIPAGLSILPRAKPRTIAPLGEEIDGGPLDTLFSHWGNAVFKNKKLVFGAVVIVAVGSIIGLGLVHIHEGLTANMRPDSETIKADTLLNEKFGGTTVINIIIEGTEMDSIKSPELMRRMDEFQAYAERHPMVGDSLSIAEYLKRMNKVMNEDREEFNRVPESRDLIAQYLLLYSISGDPDDFDDVVDYEYSRANISIFIRTDSGEEIGDIFSYLEPQVKKAFEDLPFNIVMSGRGKMTLLVVSNVIRDQLQSFIIAIIAVFLITSIMFGSARIGLITIVPISIASLANFGLMGVLGLPLQVATTFSACVGIGIGIDYTIHFFAKYRRLTAHGHEGAEANVLTMQTSGRAILFNAVVVAFGFLVLIWSNSPPNRNMGILVSLNMATSFLGAMTVLPCILNLVRRQTILPPLKDEDDEQKE